MTSVELRLSAEDPDLLFQFSSPIDASAGNNSNRNPSGTQNWDQHLDLMSEPNGLDRHVRLRATPRLAASTASTASTLLEDDDDEDDETQTLFGSVAPSNLTSGNHNSNGAVNAAPASVVQGSSSSQHTRAAAPAASRYNSSFSHSRTFGTPRNPSSVHVLSNFNNILSRSLSAHQLQDIERMVDEFWLRDSKLTEDMFDDSSDEE
ncbi:uncharacterized protein LALA0_S04e02278g [Lachancea lanzarotensis]|uniref:LALA0S04e02278g1_1 n=1 Tax=Lachancea lanzarotensis TaxID=1245769 RepID=A0A0C7N8U5_9SACH|nr:uncharacterized protein LALA0_S04e02278g [Lachancea lanzarotensis]CEP61857.1 LALA0S04e02278g1_1 [Lachancea lanzarotensis]